MSPHLLLAIHVACWALTTHVLLCIWSTDCPHDTKRDLLVYAAVWGAVWFVLPAIVIVSWVYLRFRK